MGAGAAKTGAGAATKGAPIKPGLAAAQAITAKITTA